MTQPSAFLPARLSALGLAAAIAIAACSGASIGSATSSAAASGVPSPSVTASTGTSPPTGTVSANTASTGELAAALEAAGVKNADRWAREIIEYRPYDAADPTLEHLQDELAKYNPDPVTLAAILSVLTP